jgi:hypothetical protein
MKYVTTIVVVIFIFVASFGFIMTEHAMANVHSAHDQSMSTMDCIIAVMGFCSTDGLTMAEHHLNAYQWFLNNPTSEFFSFAVTLVCLGLLSLFIVSQQSHRMLAVQTLPVRARLRNTSYSDFYHKQKISHWLSLFETSPTFA